jgi:uncharacterized LabA/DUF88 family protein
MPVRVAVFIDWQNTYKAAREAFGYQALPNEHGNYSPYRLAKILAAGHERGDDGELVRVAVHRGLPSSSRDSVGYGACRRQSAAWMQENEDVVIPRLRPLRYPRDESEAPVEKGVDVELAIGAVEQVVTGGCDVAVIFTNDTDLLPAIEAIARLKGTGAVETAAWRSDTYRSRLRPKPTVYHHDLSERCFMRAETCVNYAYSAKSRAGRAN